MKYTITEDRTKLTILTDRAERQDLHEMSMEDPEDFKSDDALWEFLDDLLCNSDLMMTDAATIGDLTDAPMLCTIDEHGMAIERWAFMDYQVRSPLEDLRDTGKCIFIGGPL